MSTIPLNEAINYLDNFRKFVIKNDIPRAIKEDAIYLAALGLSTYTEFLGGLYCGDLKTGLGQHYTCFINEFFHSDYMKVDQSLKKANLNGLYGAVRSGLAHEYFMKKKSMIVKDSTLPINCGITYDPHNDHQLVFYVNPYFQDFKDAFEGYYNKLKDDQSGNPLRKFENALGSINSGLIGRLSENFSEEVSGKSL